MIYFGAWLVMITNGGAWWTFTRDLSLIQIWGMWMWSMMEWCIRLLFNLLVSIWVPSGSTQEQFPKGYKDLVNCIEQIVQGSQMMDGFIKLNGLGKNQVIFFSWLNDIIILGINKSIEDKMNTFTWLKNAWCWRPIILMLGRQILLFLFVRYVFLCIARGWH